MDRYDDMLLKARAEMLGQEPLRKAPPHDALFSHVWESVVKAPMQMSPEQYEQFQANQQVSQQRRDQERQQQVQQRTQSSPQPIDPFGQMNEGASLDQPAPPTGMRANFRQGQQETRDPNKKGMFGRFMDRFRRQPSQQTESTPPSLQEEQAQPADERAFRDTPRAELPPSFQSWNRYDRNKDPFPTRDWVRNTMKAGGNDLTVWDRMNALREQREAEAQQTQQAEQGNDLRAATKDKMTPSAWPSPMQEAQEMKTPVDAGLDAMREPAVPDDFYDRFAGVEEQPMRQPQPEAPAPVEEQREFVDPFGQMNALEEREIDMSEDLDENHNWIDPDFNTEIEPQSTMPDGRPITIEEMEDDAEENPETEDAGISEWLQANPGNELESMDLQDTDSLRDWVERNPEAVEQMGYSRERQEGKPTTQSGTKIPRKALPAPKVAPENRQLPESVGDTETGEMAGIAGRKGFQEVNKRPDAVRFGTQAPDARDESGRLKEKKRRDKALAARSVDPTEATEKVLNPPKPKKAAPKKAKKSPAAKAVKATASKRKAKAKPLEGTEEMREEAPPKKKTGTKAKRGKKPVQEDIEGAQVMEEKAPPKKGAKKVKETTSKAKPKKGSALATVNEVAEQRKKGADPSKNIFADKAKPARTRTKNPKKTAVKGMGEAAERSRLRQAAKAKKNEPSEESAPQKEYGLSISGSASPDEISEIMEAARSGNKSAQSAIYNNAGTLEDEHGISADDIQEASGR